VGTRLTIALVLLVAAAAAAWSLERRGRAEPPARGSAAVPAQLDRRDFPRPDATWLVVLFSSATCESCASMGEKVRVLESTEVAVADVEFGERPDLHERYGIDAVPVVAVADVRGVTRAAFVGRATATDLWAAVAELRCPGTSPEPGLGGLGDGRGAPGG